MLVMARSRTLEVASAAASPRSHRGDRLGGPGLEFELVFPGCVEDLVAAIEEALGECGIAEFVVDHIHGVGDAASHERVQDMLGDFDTEILRGSPPCGLAHALRVDKGAVHVEDDCLHMWVLSGNCLGSMVSGRGAVHVWREARFLSVSARESSYSSSPWART